MPSLTPELPEETNVVLIQIAHIRHVVLQVGQSFHAHAEREAGILPAVDAAHFQHLRVYHAAAQNLDPAGGLADAAALAAAGRARQVDLLSPYQKDKG